MTPVSLYRAYRPLQFSDVVGQEHVILALSEAIRSGKIHHAYLFCGTRGTGKTSLAKIFARAINCLSDTPNRTEPCNNCAICQAALDGSLLDIIEMDAASNNSVESIRHIVEEVHFTPTQTRYKVYIIDEAHMLSNGAFNALLKTLEEPPAHAVFILATTDPQRIPATILSRCQRYDLRALTVEEIQSRLQLVCDQEGIPAKSSALQCLAQQARGALRDALSLLDQCRVRFVEPFGREDVLELLGFAGDSDMLAWLEAFTQGDLEKVLRLLQQFLLQGQDVLRLLNAWLQALRDLLLCKLLTHPEELLQIPKDQIHMLQALAQPLELQQLQQWIQEFSLCVQACKTSEQPRLMLESALISLCPLPSTAPAAKPAPASIPVEAPPAENAPDAKPAPTPASVPLEAPPAENAPDAKPAPAPASVPLEAPPAENAPDAKPAPIAEIETPDLPSAETLWPSLLDWLRTNGAVVLYLMLHSFPATFRGREIRLFFTSGQKDTYNIIHAPENQDKLQQALKIIGGPSPLILTIETENTTPKPSRTKPTTERMRELADQYQIPFEEK